MAGIGLILKSNNVHSASTVESHAAAAYFPGEGKAAHDVPAPSSTGGQEYR